MGVISNVVTRAQITSTIRRAVEPLAFVCAMWEGGSAAWGRDDEWSDIDLQLLVDDAYVEPSIEAVERALSSLSKIDLCFRVPEPTWHGHAQVFYRLEDAGEFLLVDLAVMKRSSPHQLSERERHGERVLFFDKAGEAATTEMDYSSHEARMEKIIARIRVTFPLFQSLARKEALRGNALGALGFCNTHTLHPLLTLLRIRHCPDRFDFGPKYALFDLPADIYAEVCDLAYVGSLDDIEDRCRRAEELFRRTLVDLDVDTAE